MSWKRAVFALFAVAAGTNVPTPLLLVYQERLDLSAEVLTALFGCYAAGLVPALLLAGGLSDRLGRRRVAIPGIVLSVKVPNVPSPMTAPPAASTPSDAAILPATEQGRRRHGAAPGRTSPPTGDSLPRDRHCG